MCLLFVIFLAGLFRNISLVSCIDQYTCWFRIYIYICLFFVATVLGGFCLMRVAMALALALERRNGFIVIIVR